MQSLDAVEEDVVIPYLNIFLKESGMLFKPVCPF
jgi:hypothetical protein